MSYTIIIVVHKRLDKVLRYIQNKKKISLSDIIGYALMGVEVEGMIYEGIPCLVDINNSVLEKIISGSDSSV